MLSSGKYEMIENRYLIILPEISSPFSEKLGFSDSRIIPVG